MAPEPNTTFQKDRWWVYCRTSAIGEWQIIPRLHESEEDAIAYVRGRCANDPTSTMQFLIRLSHELEISSEVYTRDNQP